MPPGDNRELRPRTCFSRRFTVNLSPAAATDCDEDPAPENFQSPIPASATKQSPKAQAVNPAEPEYLKILTRLNENVMRY
jgi:hypothetical protein